MSAKNIILLSDGTGNSAAKQRKTNVYRLYQSLDLRDGSQVAFYGDGVGSQQFKLWKLLGGALGIGLASNVRELYASLCRVYKPGDRIYLFGFSRGAFTVRVLAGFIHHAGIIHADNDVELEGLIKQAYRRFRALNFALGVEDSKTAQKLRDVRDVVVDKLAPKVAHRLEQYKMPSRPKPDDSISVPIEFIGVWDTVSAYGLPIEELASAWHTLISPLRLPDRSLPGHIRRARQALAIDEERRTFAPVLWDEKELDQTAQIKGDWPVDENRLEQVWFAGVHSNVGGGYPMDDLAYVTLDWMMSTVEVSRYKKNGLKFIEGLRRIIRDKAYVHGRTYDSRAGAGAAYRYRPRDILQLSQDFQKDVTINPVLIHDSVFDRISERVQFYTPVGMPSQYKLISTPGPNDTSLQVPKSSSSVETAEQAKQREEHSEDVWDVVYCRKVLYYSMLVFTIGALLLPLWPDDGTANMPKWFERLTDPLIWPLETFLPSIFKPWVVAIEQKRLWFGAIVLAYGIFIWMKIQLFAKTRSAGSHAWSHLTGAMAGPVSPTITGQMRVMRKSSKVRDALTVIRRRVIPLLAIVAVVVGVYLLGHRWAGDHAFGGVLGLMVLAGAYNANRWWRSACARKYSQDE